MGSSNPQSRKWLLTINNPDDYELDHNAVKNTLHLFNPDYFCLVDEIATTGTKHMHIFIYSKSPIRFSTLKNRFPVAHIDKANGSVTENRDYLRKEGKWQGSDKEQTNLIDTFEEVGDVPKPVDENSPDMSALIEEIENGLDTYEIIKLHPKYAFRIKEIDTLRQTVLSNMFREKKRQVTVYYVYGKSGTGKTRGIYQKHRAPDICRITAYRRSIGINFDSYHGQSVLVFEEFASQIPIEDMLNYLDIYPLMLPARFNDKVACYDTVYITSNISLGEQYSEVQHYKPETWKAFLRRINFLVEYTDVNTYTVTEINKVKEVKADD